MSITNVVFTATKSLVNNRSYPNTFDPNRTILWPSIRYTLISAEPGPTICGTDLGETDQYRVQIDCVALTYGAAVTLRDQVMAAMEMVTDPPVTRDGMFDEYDSETKTHRASIDYLLHPSS